MSSPPNLLSILKRMKRGRRNARTILLSLFLATLSFAKNGNEALNYYGLLTLSDSSIGAKLAARFKARGQPVFLVHDLSVGLGQGDFMRFSDKAVLVDPDVWNTIQAEGALEKLRSAPLVRVQGQTSGESWEQRAEIVPGERERKAFKLGAELIRVMEETFGGSPLRNQLTVEFRDGHLTLLAPAALLDQLRFSPVRKVTERGGPKILSVAPDSLRFVGQPFFFQAWAVDPSEPLALLSYHIRGDFPPGLSWDASQHALRGTPTEAGHFHLVVEARNPKGGRDTLGFSLLLHQNRAPFLAGTPKPVAVIGKEWRFRPEPADPDHPSYVLHVHPSSLPAGMAFDPDSVLLRWTPDTALAETRQTFSLAVEDPLGARREFRYVVQVIAGEDIAWSEGIKLNLPWDTLLQGKAYAWQGGATTAAWAGQGIVLEDVVGSDSTVFGNDSLHFRPMSAGMHRLEFHFMVQDAPLIHNVFLPVREDRPPVFVTELTDWKVKAGDFRLRYRPAAVDPEGEPVALTAEIPEGSPLRWDGRGLTLAAEEPGIYPARVTATDPGGRSTEQWVAFRAEPPDQKVRWILENRVQGGVAAWSLAADFGTGRVGIFSPNLGDALSLSTQSGREFPFIFFGGNLMGRANEAKGRRLWTDLGFTLRYPDPRVATGGVYGRILGEWSFPHSLVSWVEAEFTGHIHQAVVLADTGAIRLLLRDTDVVYLTKRYGPIIQKILDDATAGDNAVFFTRLEALSALGYGFFAGPSLWREDFPMGQRFYQRLGGVFRYRQPMGRFITQMSLRLGWGSGGAGFDANANMRISFGTPF